MSAATASKARSTGEVAVVAHAGLLCLIAGFVDALGYFGHGHVFTANMTGNTVLLGAAIVRLDPVAIPYLVTIATFVAGVVIATVLVTLTRSVVAPLVASGLVLAAMSFVSMPPGLALAVLALVMGVQGGTITRFSGMRLPTVVVTSTLVNMIQGLLQAWLPGSVKEPLATAVQPFAIAWASYGAGGALAVLAEQHTGHPLMLPAALYICVALDLARRARV